MVSVNLTVVKLGDMTLAALSFWTSEINPDVCLQFQEFRLFCSV